MHKLSGKPLATAAVLFIITLAVIVVRQSLSDAAVLTNANPGHGGGGPIVPPIIASSMTEATDGGAAIEPDSDRIAGRCDEGADSCAAAGSDGLFFAFTGSADEAAGVTNLDATWADGADQEAGSAASIGELSHEGGLARGSFEEADVANETADSTADSIDLTTADENRAFHENRTLDATSAAFAGDASLAASLLQGSDGGSTGSTTPGSPDTQRSLNGRGEERTRGGGGGAGGTGGTPSSPPDAYLSGSKPPAGGGGESSGRPSALPPGGVLSVPDSLPPSTGWPEPGPPRGGTRVIESGVPYGDVRGSISGIPSPAQTPELGSLGLFATGAAGMAGYALTRLRASRRREPPSA